MYLFDSNQNPKNTLENIRNLIKSGALSEAKSEIQSLNNGKDLSAELKSELILEQCRSLIYENKFFEALEASSKYFAFGCQNEISNLTMHQLRSDIYYKLGNYTEALENAQTAAKLAEKNPMASSATSAFVFLAMIYTELEQKDEALHTLKKVESYLDKVEQTELWIDRQMIFQRGQFKVYQKLKQWPQALTALHLAKELAQFTRQEKILEKCLGDILDVHEHMLNTNFKFNRIERDHLVLLADLQLLLDTKNNKAHRFYKKPIQSKILRFILDGITDQQIIFESIWGFKFKKELHASLLRTHLYQLRKIIPDLR